MPRGHGPRSFNSRRRRATPRTSRAAKVIESAVPEAGDQNDKKSQMIERIRKCLDRANHPNTPESEAQSALRMSSMLMAQINITQAEVIAQATSATERARFGGHSIVSITNKSPQSKVTSQTWVHQVASAITIFFDCSSYRTSRLTSVDWTFYGIAENTVAAANAFEMAHNMTLEWCRTKKGGKSTNSFCFGVGIGLKDIATAEKRNELSAVSSSSISSTSDHSQQANTWHSITALTTFRHDAKTVAEEYLKAQNLKLSSSRRRDYRIRDQAAFAFGKEMAKDIDVSRKRIKSE